MDIESIENDLAQLTSLIDAMLSDVRNTNITETSKVMDFLLDARIIASRLCQSLAEPATV